MTAEGQLLGGVQIVQAASPSDPEVLRYAIDLAGQMARQLGADVYLNDAFGLDNSFTSRGKRGLSSTWAQWLTDQPDRLAIKSHTVQAADSLLTTHNVVNVTADALESEATLFARSAFADLLGDPDSAPLIPAGRYGAGTLAYGILAAVTSLVALHRRIGAIDTVDIDASGVLSWVNWKAAAAGALGRDIKREGTQAEWPVLPCADGHVALVYQGRDWPNIVAMTEDPRLTSDRFATHKQRTKHRDEYLAIIGDWSKARTKAQIQAAFVQHQIPSAAVMTPSDLFHDELLNHRNAFAEVKVNNTTALSPRLAHRIAKTNDAQPRTTKAKGNLPLVGIRVVDLGIITAGAGVGALLADLGAEVLKIESTNYPDPFRQWSGEAVSPLFKCNNRNKYGLALDLKQDTDKARFLTLVGKADVVLENFRRGVLERLGLGFDRLIEANPNLLLASISGQGLTGPGSQASSFGSTLEAASGFATHVHYEDGTPYITGRNINYPDQTVVLYAAAVIAAALSQPRSAMHLDVSQRDVAIYLAGEELEHLSANLPWQAPHDSRAFRTLDNEWVAFDTSASMPTTQANLAAWVAAKTSEQVIETLATLGVGAAIVVPGSKMYEAMLQQGLEVFSTSPDGALVKGFPFQLRRQPMSIRLNSPQIGEHTTQFC